MAECLPIFDRFRTTLGILCLGASLALMSPGVSSVRADEAAPAAPPVDVVAAETDGEIDAAPRAVDPTLESMPGVVVLNTRGYNYGPDRPTARPVLPAAPPAADSATEK